MSSLLKLLFLFIFISFINGFNIDTDFPIIYFDTNMNSKQNKSYFGYSVILYEGDNKTEPWIQIGAPRGHNREVMNFFQPGFIYRCRISKQCKLLPVDTQVNKPNMRLGRNIHAYIAKKDKAWIGATMDIDSAHQRVVVCGPRWINERREHFIEGACYWSHIHDENSTKELLPLANTDQEIKDNVYYYPMGQAGISVHCPQSRDPQLIMGAPGVYNWKGVPLMYQDDEKMSTSINIIAQKGLMFSKLFIPDASKIKDVFSFGYLGYSISSGNFFSRNKLSYVAGAPRSSAYKGQVLVFDFSSSYGEEIKVLQTRQGQTMGEYFGAAIGVADLNGDGFDDIIVGAPRYSTKYDEGRIYIFYGNPNVNLLKPEQSPEITGNFSGGQFGTAIQSLGDIDDDGCADIAVGAPYEDDHHGVMYIYNGRRKGASLKLSQRIEGKRLYSNLRGFGISFSRPTDIDNNHFNDIAVGSFLSDNAVILRMRPTVILDMTLRTLEARLERKTTQFTIEACFSFQGRNLPNYLRVSRRIILDQNLRRVFFNNNPNKPSEQTIIILVKKTGGCANISISIKPTQNVKTDLDPIEIIMYQELIEDEFVSNPILIKDNIENVDRFCKDCPVVNRFKSVREVKIDVPFALNCGDDNKCDADLKVFAKFIGIKRNQFVIGLYKTLSLEITVQNNKEPAYLTEVEVMLPENVYLSAKPAECDEKMSNGSIVIICLVDNPLEEAKSKIISLNLDMEAVTNSKTKNKIQFTITAKSKSDDINPKDNKIISELLLVTDADIKIIGKTEKTMYYFGNDPLANATHIFEVHKSGVSPLNEFILNITIPIVYKTENSEIHFMAIHEPRGFQDRQMLTCQWPEEFIKDKEILEVENANQNITRKKRDVVAEGDNNNTTLDFTPINKILFINCSMPNVVCKTVRCLIGPFRQSLKGASLQIKMVVNMTQIKEHILGTNEVIFLSTDGSVKEIEGSIKDQIRVSTVFVKEPEDSKVDSWIIIVAIVAGILILLLIVLGLVKAGFFERKQKAELEALKQAEVEQEFDNREPSTECVSETEDEE